MNSNTLIISYGNALYKEIALNWGTALSHLEIDNYLIFSIDEECHEFLEFHGINSTLHPIPDLPEKQARGGMTKRMGIERFYIIKSLLEEGRDIIYSDLDAVWIKNPLADCANFENDNMVASVVDHKGAWPPKVSKVWGFTLCTGWFGFKSCQENIEFIDDLISFFANRPTVCDQDAYNSYLLSLQPSLNHNCKPHLRRLILPNGSTLLALNKNLIKRGHPHPSTLVGHPVSHKTAWQTKKKLIEKNFGF